MAYKGYDENTMPKKLGQTYSEYTEKINNTEKQLFDNDDFLNTTINNLPNTADSEIKMNGSSAKAGTSAKLAKADHIHPHDTSKLDVQPVSGVSFLDSAKKVNPYYLPDSILGQVRYCGTWDASNKDTANTTLSEQAKPSESSIWVPRAGDYFICTKAGKYSPSTSTIKAIEITGNDDYQPGDWALINSVSSVAAETVPDWGKIDNTDAVRTVNNHIGDVKTYHGDWLASTQYRVGDFVQKDNVLYICIKDAEGEAAKPTQDITNQYWKPSVISVNGKTGVVNIWRDLHNKNEKYDAGDLVRQAKTGDIYVCLKDTAKDSGIELTNTEHWKITGKVYTNAQAPSEGNPGNDGLMSALDKSNLDANTAARHTHTNKALLDTYTQTEANLADAVNKKHSHSNKALLDTYDQTNADIKDAVDKKHTHTNKGILDATTASFTTEEETKLRQIDDSLLGVTADDIGKVKDVKVNGTSVLGTDGVAAITIADLEANFVSVTTTDSVWTTKTVNGTDYQAITVEKTDTALGVFNSDNQEIVVQKVYEDNYLYLLVGTSAINCTIRKLSGGAVGTGGSGDVTAAGNNTFTGTNTFTSGSIVVSKTDWSNKTTKAEYGSGAISFTPYGETRSKLISLPAEEGTLALTRDIPAANVTLSGSEPTLSSLKIGDTTYKVTTINDIPTVTHKYLHHLYITGYDETAKYFAICAMYVSNSNTEITNATQLLSAVQGRIMATGYCGGTNTTKPVYFFQKSQEDDRAITIHSVTDSGDDAVDVNLFTITGGSITDTVTEL